MFLTPLFHLALKILMVMFLGLWLAATEDRPAHAQDLEPSIAFIGDSISTGAASHPQLTLSRKKLWEVFLGPDTLSPKAADLPQDLPWKYADPLAKPRATWPTWRELFHGVQYTFLVFVNGISQTFLNTEEYSWGYQLGQGLGIKSSQIYIAAENGAKIGSLNRQIDRLLVARQGLLPHKVFILFTGNDICGPTLPMMTPADDFAAYLDKGLRYLSRFPLPPGGTDVYVVAYLNVTQIVTNPSILEKSVLAFGDQTTCGTLHKQYFTPTEDQLKSSKDQLETTGETGFAPWFPWLFSSVMPPSPAGMCPNLFANVSPETLSTVANRIRAFRQKSEEVVQNLQKTAPQPSDIRFHWLARSESVRFDGDDIAGDCFHLSPKGQGKLAVEVAKSLAP